jgi:acyl-CoA dehydrogenase
MRSLVMPAACEATMALVQRGETIALKRLRATPDKEDGFGLMTTDVEEGAALLEFDMPGLDLFDGAAALTASVMVGAMSRSLATALSYANDRRQFGRPLGKFQAIQHQLGVAAEHVALAGVAARMPFVGNDIAFGPMRTAIAKLIANQAADIVCGVVHAVHGAIGISHEHDLQLHTRRLRRWQQSFGSETFWARRLGTARIADRSYSTVDFLRAL